jgi:hypothetical protein
VALLQGFIRSVVFVQGIYLSRPWRYFSRPRRCRTHVSMFTCVRCMSRRCSLASSPRAWAHSRRLGRALRLFRTSPHYPSAGRGGEVSATPIERVANYRFLFKLLSGGSSGRPCPRSIRVGSWSGDSSMKALTRVCLVGLGPVRWGPRARKLSLGGIPRLAALVGS